MMKIFFTFFVLFIQSSIITIHAGVIDDWYQENILKRIEGVPTQAELAKEFAEALMVKTYAESRYAEILGTKCFLKNGQPSPRGPISVEEVATNTRNHVLLWGDSMTAALTSVGGLITVNPEIYFGSKANNIMIKAVGSSSSEDLRHSLDVRADYNPFLFYPDPHTNNHVNLENKTAVILIGGNDLLRFEMMLKAIPWLTIFRQNSVVNNLNRIVTYHQAQGARVLLLGQTPRPSDPPEFVFFGDLGVLGDFYREMLSAALEMLGAGISATGAVFADIDACISAGQCHRPLNSLTTVVSSVYAGSHENVWEDYIIARLGMAGTDTTWLSQQLGYQTIMVKNLVAMTRNAEHMDEWFAFSDPGALAAGKWWVGNPSLYLEDRIHFSHPWGHSLHTRNLDQKLTSLNWWENPIPTQGDRCNFTSSATFPTGQPAGWTEEPPELPAADDNTLLLLILCFYFGHCSV